MVAAHSQPCGSLRSESRLRRSRTDDMDRDATADLLATESTIDTVSLLLNDGAARFAPDFFKSNDTDNRGVATGDFDHDGILDLVIANAKNDSFAF